METESIQNYEDYVNGITKELRMYDQLIDFGLGNHRIAAEDKEAYLQITRSAKKLITNNSHAVLREYEGNYQKVAENAQKLEQILTDQEKIKVNGVSK